MPNNLNQLARWANTHAAAVEAVEVVHRPRVVRANPNVAPSSVNSPRQRVIQSTPLCHSPNHIAPADRRTGTPSVYRTSEVSL